MMQEESTQKTISLVIKGGKINADILKASMRYFLGQHQKHKAKQTAKQKAKEAAKNAPVRGKQTLKELTAQNGKLANIQVTEKNIGSFDRVARKYSIDYALKKDKSVSPPVYYVFFKAKDLDVMTAAFKEYSTNVAKKQTRPSLLKKLAKALSVVRSNKENQKERHKHKEQSL